MDPFDYDDGTDDQQAQLLAALSGVPIQKARIDARRRRGEALFATPTPQGRTVGPYNVYIGASPLEHLASAISRGMGLREMKAAETEYQPLIQQQQAGAAAQARLQRADKNREFGLRLRGAELADMRAMSDEARAASEAKVKAAQQAEIERHNREVEASTRRGQSQDSWAVVADPVTGGFVRYNKKTGETAPVRGSMPGSSSSGAESGTTVDESAGFKMTESQAKAFSAVNRIREARKMMEEAGYPSGATGRWDAAATGAGKGSSLVPQEAATEKGQRYFTAGRNLIAALLRKESGAAITKDEWEELGPLYIPMPWDDEQTKANKLRMLDVMTESAIAESGPAAGAHLKRRAPASQPKPSTPSPDLRKKYGL